MMLRLASQIFIYIYIFFSPRFQLRNSLLYATISIVPINIPNYVPVNMLEHPMKLKNLRKFSCLPLFWYHYGCLPQLNRHFQKYILN